MEWFPTQSLTTLASSRSQRSLALPVTSISVITPSIVLPTARLTPTLRSTAMRSEAMLSPEAVPRWQDTALWSVQAAAPSRMPEVCIAETSGMRRRFHLPASRGLTPGLLGSSMPCSDDLLGHGSLDRSVHNDPGIDAYDFFGIASASCVGPGKTFPSPSSPTRCTDTAFVIDGGASTSSCAAPPDLDNDRTAADCGPEPWSKSSVGPPLSCGHGL